MPNYNNLKMNDKELLNEGNYNYNLNCINNSNIKNRFIKNGEEYNYDYINKECGLLEHFKNNVFVKRELKVENPISFSIIVTNILNL